VRIAADLPTIVRAAPVAVVGALTAALAGCALGGPLKTEHQSQEYAEPVTRIEITLDAGDVTFSPSAADTVSVSRRLQWRSSKPVVSETIDAGVMRISVTCANQVGTCEVDYGLKVPAAASVQVRSDSGDVSITDLTGGADVDTDSGDITLDGAGGVVRVVADSGEINADRLSSDDIRVSVDSGDIALAFLTAPTSVDLQSQSGSVTVTVPRVDGGYRVRAATDSGRRTVTIDEAATAGSRSIVATTESGDVTVGY
jgi:hypothetical protein